MIRTGDQYRDSTTQPPLVDICARIYEPVMTIEQDGAVNAERERPARLCQDTRRTFRQGHGQAETRQPQSRGVTR